MAEHYKSAIYHLVFYKNIVVAQLRSLHTFISHFENEETRPLYALVYSDTLLTATKFLDEYDNFFRADDAVISERINETKKILKPAIREIRKWKELSEFRNKVLAHNLRIREKNNESVFEHGGFSAFQIPDTVTELLIMIECISLVGQLIERKFEKEYNEFHQSISQARTTHPPRMNIEHPEEYIRNIVEEMKKIANESDQSQINAAASRQHISFIAQQVAKETLLFSPQLYSVKDHQSRMPPRPDSTAVLIEITGRFFMVTTGHTVQGIDLNHLGIMIKDEFITIGGDLQYFEPNDEEHYEPGHLDLAVWELSPAMVEVIRQQYQFLPWDKVAINHPPAAFAPYLVTGYPGETTTKNFPTKTITPQPMILTTIGMDAQYYAKENLNADKTLALEGNQQRIGELKSGQAVQLPPLGGISGCGVWHVAELTTNEPHFELVGIMTGENTEKTVLFATRVKQMRNILINQFGVVGIS